MGYYNQYLYENAITWTTDGANAGTVNFRSDKFYCTNVCGVLLKKEYEPNVCLAMIIAKQTYKYVFKELHHTPPSGHSMKCLTHFHSIIELINN